MLSSTALRKLLCGQLGASKGQKQPTTLHRALPSLPLSSNRLETTSQMMRVKVQPACSEKDMFNGLTAAQPRGTINWLTLPSLKMADTENIFSCNENGSSFSYHKSNFNKKKNLKQTADMWNVSKPKLAAAEDASNKKDRNYKAWYPHWYYCSWQGLPVLQDIHWSLIIIFPACDCCVIVVIWQRNREPSRAMALALCLCNWYQALISAFSWS